MNTFRGQINHSEIVQIDSAVKMTCPSQTFDSGIFIAMKLIYLRVAYFFSGEAYSSLYIARFWALQDSVVECTNLAIFLMKYSEFVIKMD